MQQLVLVGGVGERCAQLHDVTVSASEDEADIRGSLDQGGFIGRLSLVLDHTGSDFRCQGGVTQTKNSKEAVQEPRLFSLGVVHVRKQFWIMEGSQDLFG